MKVNGEAIHATRPVAPCKDGNVRLTGKKDGTVYAIYLGAEDEQNPPSNIRLNTLRPGPGATVSMLGIDETLKWETAGKGVIIDIPLSARKQGPCRHAWTIKFSRTEK